MLNSKCKRMNGPAEDMQESVIKEWTSQVTQSKKEEVVRTHMMPLICQYEIELHLEGGWK